MKRFLRNTHSLVSHPNMLPSYVHWIGALALLGRTPCAEFLDGVRFSGFSCFSEYWNRRQGIATEDLQVIKACLSQSQGSATAIDVGANIGLYTLAMARLGYAAVHAFEPIAPTFERLLLNLSLNPELKNVVIPNLVGLGEVRKQYEFHFDPKSSGQSKIATIVSNDNNSQLVVKCNVITLDEYVDTHNINDIALLKIDVEGYETQVLRGAEKTLASGHIRYIFLEIIPEALIETSSSVDEILDLLSQYQFIPVICEGNVRPEFRRVSLKDAIDAAGARRNVLFRYDSR